MKCLTCKSRMVISSKEVTKESGKVEYSFRCPNCNPNDMERVKELEERLNDPFICDNINLEDINDIRFLIDTAKQQNEQIENQDKENNHLENERDYFREEYNSCLSDLKQKDQRIERLEMHERNQEKAIEEIVLTVKRFDEELAYDCEKIVDYWAQS